MVTGAAPKNDVSGKVEFVQEAGKTRLHLAGQVPTAHRGYLEARLPLHPEGRNFDAQGYSGIRLRVKGDGKPYSLRLRTKDTRHSAQYYEAALATTGSWQA